MARIFKHHRQIGDPHHKKYFTRRYLEHCSWKTNLQEFVTSVDSYQLDIHVVWYASALVMQQVQVFKKLLINCTDIGIICMGAHTDIYLHLTNTLRLEFTQQHWYMCWFGDVLPVIIAILRRHSPGVAVSTSVSVLCFSIVVKISPSHISLSWRRHTSSVKLSIITSSFTSPWNVGRVNIT